MKIHKYCQYVRVLLLSCLITAIVTGQLAAQDWEKVEVTFRSDGKVLDNANMPGLMTPDFSNFDFNGDGHQDLFAFDRQNNTVLPFIWDTSGEEGRLVYDGSYASSFPSMTEFAKVLDYDRDGDHDLFTFSGGQGSPASGITLFRNEGTDVAPDFQKVRFPNFATDVLYFNGANGVTTELFFTFTDVPSIVDEDGDGDFDILLFEDEAAERMVLYRNLQVENNFPKDSMYFERGESCWGRFRESGLNADILLSTDFNGCGDTTKLVGSGGSDSRHAGSTTEVLDLDGDGDMDILVGDLSSSSIVALYNEPEDGIAYMTTQEQGFPSYDVPIGISVFVNASYVDVNADGKRDLIASPNDSNSADNLRHIWMYENVGTDAAPVFEFRTTEFLTSSSLMIPERSKPAFVDVNQDGLYDMVVGCFGYFNTAGLATRLFYYENIGTATEPIYELVDANFLSFSLQPGTSVLHPAFGDMDNDGDLDLLVGEQEGQLFHFENTAQPGEAMQLELRSFPFLDIDINRKSKPYFADLDQDGLPDLIVGEERDNQDPLTGTIGGLNYFRNMSGDFPDSLYSTQPQQVALGAVFTRQLDATSGSSSPAFIPTNTGDDFIAVVGSRGGNIYVYDNVVDNLQDSFNLVTDRAPIPHYGGFTGIDLADIDNDNYYEMVIGNENGGLVFHNTPFQVMEGVSTETIASTSIGLYPTPAYDQVSITADGPLGSYSIVRSDGQLVRSSHVVDGTISLEDIPAGFYLLIAEVAGRKEVQKLLIAK